MAEGVVLVGLRTKSPPKKRLAQVESMCGKDYISLVAYWFNVDGCSLKKSSVEGFQEASVETCRWAAVVNYFEWMEYLCVGIYMMCKQNVLPWGIILNQKKKKTDLNIMEDVQPLIPAVWAFSVQTLNPVHHIIPVCQLSVYGEGQIGYICSLVFGEKNQQKVTFYKKIFSKLTCKNTFLIKILHVL